MFGSGLDSERAFGHDATMGRTDVRQRGRTKLAVVLTVSLAGAAWAGPLLRAFESSDPVPVDRTSYVVQEGDTLWSIAERLAPGQDPRPLVDALTAANGLDPGALVPGEAILVPAGV